MLPNDVARCAATGCPRKDDCARKEPIRTEPGAHIAGSPTRDDCPHFIKRTPAAFSGGGNAGVSRRGK